MTDKLRTAQRLTIVLPLKGRELFTLRFLWHANKARMPYRFLIADGQMDPVLAELLEMPHVLFPNIDVEYIRYPDDCDFSHYFAKMLDALGRVTTPYVMLADNDDFLALRGIERSIDFLDSKPDYVCCGGGISGFSVYSPPNKPFGGLVGPLNKITARYMPYDRSSDLGSPQVTERLLLGLRNSWSYYAVFRSSALVTVWREIVDMNLSDLQLVEKFCAMRTLTLGKAKSDPSTIAYFRQYWTSLRSAFTEDWVHHLLRNRFSKDFANIIDRVSSLAAEADGLDQKAVAESLRGRIEPWLREFLRLNYGLSADVRRHLRRLAPSLLVWLKTRRRPSVRVERHALFSKLRKNGAGEEYLNGLRLELAQIEEVVAGREFREFLATYASQLVRGAIAARLAGSLGRV